MVRLSDLNVMHCRSCGKLFQAELGRVRCAACTGEAEHPATDHTGGIVHSTPNFTWQDVYEVLDHEEAPLPVKEQVPCVRCRARHALGDSEFCLHCLVDLRRGLGKAARDLFTRMEVIEEPIEGAPSVSSILAERRNAVQVTTGAPSQYKY